MTKLNNSNELLELIKLSATKLYNWRGEEKLVVRLGFGVMCEEDTLLTMSDVNEYGAMTDTDPNQGNYTSVGSTQEKLRINQEKLTFLCLNYMQMIIALFILGLLMR